MTRKKKANVIGFDPLAWMKEDSRQSPVVSHPSTPAAERAGDLPVSAIDDPRPTTHDAPGAIVLGDTLTVEQVAALHADLVRQLAARQVVLRAEALTRVDAAGLQLLAAFMRAAGERGVGVEWQGPPPMLRDAARRLGLSAVLRLG